jgi:hypothetical protein
MKNFFKTKDEAGCYIYNGGVWFSWLPSEKEATLDGRFTAKELKAIAERMEKRKC